MNSNAKPKWFGPIAVGGVGGSGTRVIAEILIKLGFYMGSDLNAANDNLWFTLLFKRPDWFIGNSRKKESRILKGLSIFEKAMTASLAPKISELNFIMRAAVEMAVIGNRYLYVGPRVWPIKRAINMLTSPKKIDISEYIGWGWKEPNTHIFIEYLSKYFNNLKYIHVVRHGMDMAYSRRQPQLYNWGKMFGIKVCDSSTPLPKLSLKYWIDSNKRAIAFSQKLLDKRFLVINFDRLCLAPEREIELLIDFLGLDIKEVNTDDLASIPKIPNSMGRYVKYDMSIFSKDEIEMVKELGFEVDIKNEEIK